MVTLHPAVQPGATAIANITVWITKKNDRGRFNVYAGQTLLVRSFYTLRLFADPLSTIYRC